MKEVIGIDLGTTNSVMAYFWGDKPKIIPNAEMENLTPSVVFLSEDNIPLVGEVARKAASSYPERTILSIKRMMGSDDKVKVNGKSFSPQEISSFILSKLKRDAEKFLGHKVEKAVITVPAYFNEVQRQATYEAGVLAGWSVMRIISEPTAASLAYGLEKQDVHTIAVWDLGGGTFDVSILELGNGFFEVKAVNGNTLLGGDDWDRRIMNWIKEELKIKANILLSEDPGICPRLREIAEQAKIALSSENETAVIIPCKTHDREIPLGLSRQKFHQLTADLLYKMVEPTQRALSDAQISPEEIDKIVLVGGSTRMPQVRELARKIFHKEPLQEFNPDEVVALGAAVQAAILNGNLKNVVLVDVIPLSLGIGTQGGIFSRLIKRNTPIPTSFSKIFTTAENNQTEVYINVFQGERGMTQDNVSIGEVALTDIPPAPRGVPKIEVDFVVDPNGILNVSAKNLHTEKEEKVKIKHPKLHQHEIEQKIKEAEIHTQEDKEKKEETETKIRAENLIHLLEEGLRTRGVSEREFLSKGIKELKLLLKTGKKEQIKNKMDLLFDFCKELVS